MNRIIFHFPIKIKEGYATASQIRPMNMLNAFRQLYDENVDVVIGNAKERKEQIKKIKRNIKKGIKYDFIYSENSNVPTLLTESHHLPLYPFFRFWIL